MEPALGSFFLAVVKELRDVVAKMSGSRKASRSLTVFLDLYSSTMRLQSIASELAPLRITGDEIAGMLLSDYFSEVRHFCRTLSRANLAVIAIYFPEASRSIARAVEQDIRIYDYVLDIVDREIDPNLDSSTTELAKLARLQGRYYAQKHIDLESYQEQYSCWPAEASMLRDFPSERYRHMPEAWLTPMSWSNFDELQAALNDLSAQLAEVVRSTWSFKDLGSLL